MDVDYEGSGGSSEHEAAEVLLDQDYDMVLTSENGHQLPKDIAVSAGGCPLASETAYIYDSEPNAVHISGERAIGALVINDTGEVLHTVTVVYQLWRTWMRAP